MKDYRKIEMVKEVQSGNTKNIEKLVNENTGLIKQIIKSLRIPNNIEYEDLYQEGVVGLIRAIKKFNSKKDVEFSTYATYWIKKSIIDYLIKNVSVLSYPYYFMNNMTKIKRIEYDCIKETGELPSTKYISEKTGLLEKDINNCNKYNYNLLYLEEYVSKDNECKLELKDIVDSKQYTEKEAVDKIFSEEIIKIIENNTNERERKIMYYIFGLNGEEKLDLAEIGLIFQISKERVRQIEESVLKKLRKTIEIKSLEKYYCKKKIFK